MTEGHRIALGLGFDAKDAQWELQKRVHWLFEPSDIAAMLRRAIEGAETDEEDEDEDYDPGDN